MSITIDLESANGGVRSFNVIEQALVFAEDQQGAWHKAFRNYVTHANGADDAIPSIINAWALLAGRLRAIRDDIDDNKTANEVYQDKRLIVSDSPNGNALSFVISEVGVVGAEMAARWLGFSGASVAWEETSALAGIAAFQFYQNNYMEKKSVAAASRFLDTIDDLRKQSNDTKTTFDALNEIHHEFISDSMRKVSEIQGQTEAIKVEVERLSLSIKDNLSRLDADVLKSVADSNRRFSDLSNKTAEDLDAWKLSREQAIVLEAPATLWRSRAVSYKKTALARACISLIVGIVGLSVAPYLAKIFLSEASAAFRSVALSAEGVSGAKAADLLRSSFHFAMISTAAASLIYFTMFFWLMRVVIRTYTTERHLAVDASARSAMTETYLSLIREKGATDAERLIVLEALFRPVVDGMMGEDGPPQMSPAAIIAAAASGKTGS